MLQSERSLESVHFFQKFVRLKRDLAGRVRGSGLGLYIRRQLVETMHRQMWVESSGKLGEGVHRCLWERGIPGS
jgi:signal transduction histidine kinase